MNTEIIEDLYRHHYKYLFMVAYNICRSWDLSEDIVQEGFICILQGDLEFENVNHGRRYLSTVVKHQAFKRLSREARIKAVRREFIHEISPKYTDQVIAQLGASLAKMRSSMTRSIINEIYFHSRTRKEVAEIFEISKTAVIRQEQKGLMELAKLIVR